MRAIATLGLLLTLASPVERLDDHHDPLSSDFRQADGNVRLVLLLSPT